MITVTKGTRLSYEDVANPRRLGTVVNDLGSVVVVEWDCPLLGTYREEFSRASLERLLSRNAGRTGTAGFRLVLGAVG